MALDDPDNLATDVQMASPNAILWCLLEGTSSAFDVTVSMDDNVSKLKKLIKAERPNRLKTLDAAELRIFKVCTFRLVYSSQLMHSWKLNASVKLSPMDTLSARLPSVEFYRELEPHDILSVLEPLTPNHIHIMVRRPSGGECNC